MFYETIANKHGLKHDPFKALVAPRPLLLRRLLHQAQRRLLHRAQRRVLRRAQRRLLHRAPRRLPRWRSP